MFVPDDGELGHFRLVPAVEQTSSLPQVQIVEGKEHSTMDNHSEHVVLEHLQTQASFQEPRMASEPRTASEPQRVDDEDSEPEFPAFILRGDGDWAPMASLVDPLDPEDRAFEERSHVSDSEAGNIGGGEMEG